MFTLICGCNVGDGKVKYHLNPPMSYHTLTFEPLPLAASVAKTYIPREFIKVDKRFRAIRANLIVQSSQDATTATQATNILSNAEVSLAIKDSSGTTIFTDSGLLASLPHRIVTQSPLVISFGFPKGTFDPNGKQLGSAELQIIFPEDAKGADSLTAYLEFTEIRGK